jgi:hypothetical protein
VTEVPDKCFAELDESELRGTPYRWVLQEDKDPVDVFTETFDEGRRRAEKTMASVIMARLVANNDITFKQYDDLCNTIIDGESYGDITL